MIVKNAGIGETCGLMAGCPVIAFSAEDKDPHNITMLLSSGSCGESIYRERATKIPEVMQSSPRCSKI